MHCPLQLGRSTVIFVRRCSTSYFFSGWQLGWRCGGRIKIILFPRLKRRLKKLMNLARLHSLTAVGDAAWRQDCLSVQRSCSTALNKVHCSVRMKTMAIFLVLAAFTVPVGASGGGSLINYPSSHLHQQQHGTPFAEYTNGEEFTFECKDQTGEWGTGPICEEVIICFATAARSQRQLSDFLDWRRTLFKIRSGHFRILRP